MTGTGTQQDPYVVDNFDDFLTAVATDGAYVELDNDAESKVIDINNTEYSLGLTTAITFNCAHVEGNGWTIRNLYINRDDISMFVVPSGKNTVVEDIKFLNIVYLTAAAKPVFDLYACEWKNCAFSGMYSCSATSTSGAMISNAQSGDSVKMTYCSLYFNTFVNRRFQLFNYGSFDTCNFCINLSTGASETIRHILYGATVTNCILRGSLEFKDSGSVGMFTSSTVRTSYIAMDVTVGGEYSPTLSLSAQSYATVCFYDSGTIAESVTVTGGTGNMKALTTAQCQDAAYLTSIGFPCAVGGV